MILDIVLILITLVSAFFGYKKGLVKLGAGLLAGIVALILTIALYNPISQLVIDNTQLDEKIEEIFVKNATSVINDQSETQNENNEISKYAKSLTQDTLEKQSKNLSKYVVYAIIAIIIFVLMKIILKIIISVADVVAKLPILKQFNEVGGTAYGLLRGAIFSLIIILLVTMFAKVNPENKINNYIDGSFLTKIVYENVAKIK